MTDQVPQAPQAPQVPQAFENAPQTEKNSSNKIIIIAIIIVVALVVFGIVGRSVLSRVFNRNNNSVTLRTNKGTATIASQVLPSDFPTDVPVYPGSTVLAAVTGSGEDADTDGLSLTSADSVNSIVAYYESKLPQNGWTKEAEAKYGDVVSYTAVKGDRRIAVGVAPDSDSQTLVTITISAN